ncbi:MAG: lamin tail domain-containing protein, partial [Candidatus Marinimicrobia bacterium]|nr:lamin tail domain-containing protein [Candidatus Neomarinimicrobiota bacterium]
MNEIHYNPASSQGSDNDYEFVELYNTTAAAMDLTGWFLNDVALDVTIDADSFVVVAYTGATYAALDAPVVDAAGYFGCSNSAGTMTIFDAGGLVVDEVSYTDDPPWPTAPDGTGPSLELIDAMTDNAMAENWQASFVAYGTPGLSNSTPPPVIPYTIAELQMNDHSGDMVGITGIVMSVFDGLYTVQEGSGAYSGIWVAGGDVAVGDSVDVEGIVGESYDLTQITATTLVVHGSGYALYPATVLATGAISVEDYEGVFVYTMGTCDNPDLGYGEWSIDDGSGPVVMDDLGYAVSATAGVDYEIAGPLYYAYGAFKIEPRDEFDVVDWSPGNFCENPIPYEFAGDPEQTGAIESYEAVWYSVTTLEDFDSLYVSLCGSDFDTKLEVWGACDDADYLAYNDDNYSACGPGFNSQIEMLAVPAGTYYVKVYGFGSGSGNYALNIWGANGIAPGASCETALIAIEGENTGSGADEWFEYTATDDAVVKISSCYPDQMEDTRFGVFAACEDFTGSYNTGAIVYSDDVFGDCESYSYSSAAAFEVVAGATYYIFWDDFWGPETFIWTLDEEPIAPTDLVAEGHNGFVDLYWMPPFGTPMGLAGSISSSASNTAIEKIAQQKTAALEAEAAKRLNVPAFSDLDMDQILNMTPQDKRFALSHPIHIASNGLRTTDVTVSVTVDSWSSEASWNVYDYTAAAYLYAENQLFTTGGENQTVVLALDDGDYSVDCWDTYGDGGIAGVVSLADATVIVSWADDAYDSFGEFAFTVDATAVYGCTDPLAVNYNAAATIDDGSCYYEGDICDAALPALMGDNAASGADQWFEYTATMDGEITVSSCVVDQAVDTRFGVIDDCANFVDNYWGTTWIASNDDGGCDTYWGSSEVSFLVTTGVTYYIWWDDQYTGGTPFTWTLDEHEVLLCDDTLVPVGVPEVEPNGGMNSDPIEYDPRVCGDEITGTFWADGVNRDTDWFNFTLDMQGIISAEVDIACGDIQLLLVDENVSVVAVGSENGEGLGESFVSDLLPAGDYWLWVGSAVFEGDGGSYNYNATFSCELIEPTVYTVYRDGVELTTGIDVPKYTDAAVTNGLEYCYTVKAIMDNVETAESNVACATPDMFYPEPVGLMAGAFDAEVDLAWNPPFPMGEIALDDGTAESWFWVGGGTSTDDMFYTRLTVPTDGNITDIAVWSATDSALTWPAFYLAADDGTGAPDLASPLVTFTQIPVSTPIGAGGEWAVLHLDVPEAVLGGSALYIVTQWPQDSNSGPFVATDTDTDVGACAWTNTGGDVWNPIGMTFIMRAYMQSGTRENIEITAVARDIESNLPVYSLEDEKSTPRKSETFSSRLAVPGLQSDALRDLTGYQLYRGVESGVYTLLDDNITETMYQDMTAENGTMYYYAVTAIYDGTSESGFSNEANALPLGAAAVPYADNFDETNGGFFGGGDWQWGAPVDPPTAFSAPNVWGTVLDGEYNNGTTSFLEIPFDLSGSEFGYELSFMHYRDIEAGWDFAFVGVDHDGDGIYDILTVYSEEVLEWTAESVIIPPMFTSPYTKLAFIFQSDASVTQNGWFIDDVAVNEFVPAILTVTPEAISDTLFLDASDFYDLTVGNAGGLDLDYVAIVEYLDGITIDSLFFDSFDTGITRWTVVDGLDDGLTWAGVTDDAGNTLDGTPFAFVDS